METTATIKSMIFTFRAKKDKDTKKIIPWKIDGDKIITKHPDLTADIPALSGARIFELLTDDGLEEARKLKLLDYLADSHNQIAKVLAQKQLSDILDANPTAQLTPELIDKKPLELWAIVDREPVDRKKFSDVLIAAAIDNFISTISAKMKQANGESIPVLFITQAAKDIFTNSLSKVKTDKKALGIFEKLLAGWILHTEEQSKFMEICQHYQERITTYLNAESKSKFDEIDI